MNRSLLFPLTLVMIACSERTLPQPQAAPSPVAPHTNVGDAASIKPGFYSTGPEYEKVWQFLDTASASVGLDYHQGITWYDQDSKSGVTLETIEELKPLINSARNKTLLRISTGKAMWEKYDEYIETTIKYAEAAGFSSTVVTGAHSSGVDVSQIIHHNDEQ